MPTNKVEFNEIHPSPILPDLIRVGQLVTQHWNDWRHSEVFDAFKTLNAVDFVYLTHYGLYAQWIDIVIKAMRCYPHVVGISHAMIGSEDMTVPIEGGIQFKPMASFKAMNLHLPDENGALISAGLNHPFPNRLVVPLDGGETTFEWVQSFGDMAGDTIHISYPDVMNMFKYAKNFEATFDARLMDSKEFIRKYPRLAGLGPKLKKKVGSGVNLVMLELTETDATHLRELEADGKKPEKEKKKPKPKAKGDSSSGSESKGKTQGKGGYGGGVVKVPRGERPSVRFNESGEDELTAH
jgi:hypothetical protein